MTISIAAGSRLGLAMVLLSGAALPALAQQAGSSIPGYVAIEGQASAEVVPDIVRLTVGVEIQRPTASAAAGDMAKAAQAVVDQIKAEGIDDKAVATTAVDLAPVYPDDVQPGTTRVPIAFRASNHLVITVTPVERAGLIAAHLVEKGANTLDDIAYSSSQEPTILDGLLADATRDARHKAQIAVEALGGHLGRVLQIEPAGGGYRPTPLARMAMSKAAAVAIPIQSGTLTLQSSVNVRFEIAP